MKAFLPLPAVLLVSLSGCVLASRADLDNAISHNRVLDEQNRAQLAEIQNLKTHSRNTEDQLMLSEQKLANLEEQLGLDKQRLANYQTEREKLHEQVQGLANAKLPVTPEVNRRLAALSRRCPLLQFDPQTGISKLDTDILFDSGRCELKAGAAKVLAQLVELLKSPDAQRPESARRGPYRRQGHQAARRTIRQQFRLEHRPRPGRGQSTAADRPGRSAVGRGGLRRRTSRWPPI